MHAISRHSALLLQTPNVLICILVSRARPVLTHLLAGSAMQKMGRAHNNSIHILIGLKELAPDLAILAARACLGEARHTVCKDELLLLHCSGMLLAPLAH